MKLDIIPIFLFKTSLYANSNDFQKTFWERNNLVNKESVSVDSEIGITRYSAMNRMWAFDHRE